MNHPLQTLEEHGVDICMCFYLYTLIGKKVWVVDHASPRYCTGQMAGRDEVALSLRAADIHVSASRMETVGFTASRPWKPLMSRGTFLFAWVWF